MEVRTMNATANNMLTVVKESRKSVIRCVETLMKNCTEESLITRENTILDTVERHNKMIESCVHMMVEMYVGLSNLSFEKADSKFEYYSKLFTNEYIWTWEISGYNEFIEKVCTYKESLNH